MAYNQGNGGVYSRGHTRAASSIGYGYSILPPLSVPDTLILHSRFAQQGLTDAWKVQSVIETLATNKVAAGNVTKASLLQAVVLVSAWAIKPLLGSVLPRDHSSRQSTSGIAYILFHVLWLYPLEIAATFYAGLLKTPELGDPRRNSVASTSRNDYRGLTARLVAGSYKVLVLLNYLLVMFVLRRVPLIGAPIAFLYACIVDSYYCFEPQWIKSGWPLDERIRHLDSRWSYFIGFGFPITFLSWWSSDTVVNLAIFSLFFPLYQIMATSSLAQPLDPNIITSSMTISFLPQSQGSFSMAAAEGGEEARGRKGNPLVPTRIQVLILADKLYSILFQNFVTTGRKKDASGASYGGGGGAGLHEPPSYGWRSDGPPASHMGHGRAGHHPVAAAAATTTTTLQTVAEQPGATATYASGQPTTSVYGSYGPPSAGVQSPPRRGHVATESSVGVGIGGAGEYADRKLDNLINSAARRKKGD